MRRAEIRLFLINIIDIFDSVIFSDSFFYTKRLNQNETSDNACIVISLKRYPFGVNLNMLRPFFFAMRQPSRENAMKEL